MSDQISSIRDDRRNFVVMENGLVKIVEERITKIIPFDEFLEGVSKNFPVATPLLAPGVVFYQSYVSGPNVMQLVVYELPPGMRKYRYDPGDGIIPFTSGEYSNRLKRMVTAHQVSFPYVYFWVTIVESRNLIDQGGAFFTKKPLATIKDTIYSAMIGNLHNAYRGGHFCLGETKVSVLDVDTGKPMPVRLVIQQFLSEILNTYFNDDLSVYFSPDILERIASKSQLLVLTETGARTLGELNARDMIITDRHHVIPKHLISFINEIWEEMSAEDQFIGLKMKYLKIGSFEDFFINHLLGGKSSDHEREEYIWE